MSQFELSDQLIANVKAAEGLRLEAYKDTLGNWTYAYGHLLAPGHDWVGYKTTQDAAAALLGVDLNTAAVEAIRLPEWPCLDTPCRQDAMVELVFNMGPSKWRQFVRTRAAIADRDWLGAANGLLSSLWATQVKGRADRLAKQLQFGVY